MGCPFYIPTHIKNTLGEGRTSDTGFFFFFQKDTRPSSPEEFERIRKRFRLIKFGLKYLFDGRIQSNPDRNL